MTAPDRLSLIKARHAEAGGGDEDKAWLVAEVERLRDMVAEACGVSNRPLTAEELAHGQAVAARVMLDEALNSGDGVYRP